MTARGGLRAEDEKNMATHAPEWIGVIFGEPCSKANSRRQVPRKSKAGKTYIASIKSEKSTAYVSAALQQLRFLRPSAPLIGDLRMDCWLFYASRRPDLDESLVMDVLQGAGVIENDRQIREKHVHWGLDPLKPRAVVHLTPVEFERAA